MTSQQNAYAQMFAAVIATSQAHQSVWSSFVPFATAFNAFLDKNDQIAEASAQQAIVSEGTTAGKEQARAAVSDLAMRLADTLVLHGKVHANPQLSGDAKTVPSKLNVMSEKAFIGHITKLLSLATDIPPVQLTALNLPATHIDDTAAALTAFTTMVGKPRHIQAEAERGTQQLQDVIEDMMDILTEQMDPATKVLQYTAADFVAEYVVAREIIDPGYNTRALTVTISDSVSGATIAGVEALIMPGNIAKLTGAGGSFYLNSLAAGDYTMSLKYMGHQNKTVSFAVMNNQATVIEETLMPG